MTRGAKARQWMSGTVLGPAIQVSEVAGDVSVTLDARRPLYRVDELPFARPRLTAEEARRQPVRLLQARYRSVEFTGRADELARLARWRDSPAPASVLLLHGPGGQGKTRLADRFADESRGEGWRALAARHATQPVPPSPVAPADAPADDAGVLLVVDYAEQWPTADLLEMLTDTLRQDGRRARVLLVCRAAGLWWQNLTQRLDGLDLPALALPLGPLAAEPGLDTGTLFTGAVRTFAAALAAPDAAHLAPPMPSDDDGGAARDGFGRVLGVHMAALATVDRWLRQEPDAPLDTPERVSAYLLRRERLYWQTLHENGRTATHPDDLSHTAYTAALTGASAYDDGRTAVTTIGVCAAADADRMLKDHAVPYPPASPATVLEPLYPDQLAEDFVALTCPGHDLDTYTPDPWAHSAPRRLLSGPEEVWTRAAVTRLIATAARWPHVATAQLTPLLTQHPELALQAGGAALLALADMDHLAPAVLEAIEKQFPAEPHTELDPGIAVVSDRVLPERIRSTDDDESRARLHLVLSQRRARAGFHQRALESADAAVAGWRRLSEADPGRHERDFAAALSEQAACLSSVGEHERALAVQRAAVDVHQRLSEANPRRVTSSYAASLANLGRHMYDLGDLEGALTATGLAVEFWRLLADKAPAACEPNYAGALRNLGMFLAKAGRLEEGLEVQHRALALLRRLGAVQPHVHEPELAGALINVGANLSDVGRWAEACEPLEEAVRLLRRLCELNPAYREKLARALSNLAFCRDAQGRHDEAIHLAEDSVAINRQLVMAQPAVYEPELARSFNTLSSALTHAERHDQALAAGREGLEIRRRLARRNPAAHAHDLAESLSNHGNHLWNTGRRDEGLAAVREAVAVQRELSVGLLEARGPQLAVMLSNLAVYVSESRPYTEYVTVVEEEIALRRRLVVGNPAVHEPGLADALYRLGYVLSLAGGTERATALTRYAADALEETAAIQRRLATDTPSQAADLGRGLTLLAVVREQLALHQEALDAIEEATAVYETAVERNADELVARLTAARRVREVLRTRLREAETAE